MFTMVPIAEVESEVLVPRWATAGANTTAIRSGPFVPAFVAYGRAVCAGTGSEIGRLGGRLEINSARM